eukprot:2076806-Prymnesium_polylepis.1
MSAQPFKPVSTTYMGPFKHSNVGISPTSAMYHNGNYSPIKTAALTRVALGSRPMTFDASMLTGSMASTASLDDNASMLSSSRMSEYRRQFGARCEARARAAADRDRPSLPLPRYLPPPPPPLARPHHPARRSGPLPTASILLLPHDPLAPRTQVTPTPADGDGLALGRVHRRRPVPIPAVAALRLSADGRYLCAVVPGSVRRSDWVSSERLRELFHSTRERPACAVRIFVWALVRAAGVRARRPACA